MTREVELGNRIELATGFFVRGRGLLGRSGLVPGGGLWIVPGKRIHMCGMRFAIDAVFLSRDYRVTRVCEELEPQPVWAFWRSWGGGRGAYSVLELPAGRARQSGTAAGDRLKIENLECQV